jgi:hypothetical protein
MRDSVRAASDTSPWLFTTLANDRRLPPPPSDTVRTRRTLVRGKAAGQRLTRLVGEGGVEPLDRRFLPGTLRERAGQRGASG